MKSISINNPEFLGENNDNQFRSAHSHESTNPNGAELTDAYFCSGTLLSLTLLMIYCISGGVLVIVIATCVLVVGVGVGIIWKRYFPYQICSIVSTKQTLPSDKSIAWSQKSAAWSKENQLRIFLDDTLFGCY